MHKSLILIPRTKILKKNEKNHLKNCHCIQNSVKMCYIILNILISFFSECVIKLITNVIYICITHTLSHVQHQAFNLPRIFLSNFSFTKENWQSLQICFLVFIFSDLSLNMHPIIILYLISKQLECNTRSEHMA